MPPFKKASAHPIAVNAVHFKQILIDFINHETTTFHPFQSLDDDRLWNFYQSRSEYRDNFKFDVFKLLVPQAQSYVKLILPKLPDSEDREYKYSSSYRLSTAEKRKLKTTGGTGSAQPTASVSCPPSSKSKQKTQTILVRDSTKSSTLENSKQYIFNDEGE